MNHDERLADVEKRLEEVEKQLAYERLVRLKHVEHFNAELDRLWART